MELTWALVESKENLVLYGKEHCCDLDPDPYGPVFVRVAEFGAVLKN
jgi:hypothetical protein